MADQDNIASSYGIKAVQAHAQTVYERACQSIVESCADYLFAVGKSHPDLQFADLTDEQRAEFVAFVAHTIGYDLGDHKHLYYPNVDAVLNAYERLAE